MSVPVYKATFVVKLGGNTDIFVPKAIIVVFFFLLSGTDFKPYISHNYAYIINKYKKSGGSNNGQQNSLQDLFNRKRDAQILAQHKGIYARTARSFFEPRNRQTLHVGRIEPRFL
jgi:hypothetical protein